MRSPPENMSFRSERLDKPLLQYTHRIDSLFTLKTVGAERSVKRVPSGGIRGFGGVKWFCDGSRWFIELTVCGGFLMLSDGF